MKSCSKAFLSVYHLWLTLLIFVNRPNNRSTCWAFHAAPFRPFSRVAWNYVSKNTNQQSKTLQTPHESNQKNSVVSFSRTSPLYVSIGLGPGEEEDKEDSTTMLADYDPDDTSKDPPEARYSRMSKLDHACDEWFTSLLGDVSADSGVENCALPSEIVAPIHEKLFHQVKPSESEDPIIPIGEEEWSPYASRRLPGTPYSPPYGLEHFGIPIVRRGAEAWRQFDVAGMVETDYSGQVEGLGSNLILDAEEESTYREALRSGGTWLDDADCFARLVYVNGRYCPSLSKAAKESEGSATIFNVNARDAEEVSHLLRPETRECLERLPDGFTDEMPTDKDSKDETPLLLSKLSGPDHKVGSPTSQFAINNQQGTASFAALNALRAETVSLVDIPADVSVEKPILLLMAYTAGDSGHLQAKGKEGAGVAFHPRVVVTAGKSAKASIVQSLVDLNIENADGTTEKGSVPKLHNGYTQLFVGSDADISHAYVDECGGLVVSGVEDDDDGASETSARVRESERPALEDTILECIEAQVTGERGNYKGSVIGMGGSGRTRFALYSSLLKPTSNADVNGLMLNGGAQHGDFRTTIHHVEQGCTSAQRQKNMVGGRATATFKGRIRVEQDAQQTDSDQLSRTILLTDKCRIWAIPSLEIIADDVKCTHGATVSDLSEEELFYLRSRGLDKLISRNLLMYAFVNEVGQTVDPAVLGTDKEGLKKRIIDRLENLVPKGDRAALGEFQSV